LTCIVDPFTVVRMKAALAIVVLLASWIAPADAQAYLDPGTGSAVLQMLVATLMGALFIAKTYWRKLVAFFTGKSDDEGESGAGGTPASDDRD
jgi:hypothetical protein